MKRTWFEILKNLITHLAGFFSLPCYKMKSWAAEPSYDFKFSLLKLKCQTCNVEFWERDGISRIKVMIMIRKKNRYFKIFLEKVWVMHSTCFFFYLTFMVYRFQCTKLNHENAFVKEGHQNVSKLIWCHFGHQILFNNLFNQISMSLNWAKWRKKIHVTDHK